MLTHRSRAVRQPPQDGHDFVEKPEHVGRAFPSDVAPRDRDPNRRPRLVEPVAVKSRARRFPGSLCSDSPMFKNRAACGCAKLQSQRPILPLDERHDRSESFDDRESLFMNEHCNINLKWPTEPSV